MKTPCDYPDDFGFFHCPFDDYGGSDRCRVCCGLGVDDNGDYEPENYEESENHE